MPSLSGLAPVGVAEDSPKRRLVASMPEIIGFPLEQRAHCFPEGGSHPSLIHADELLPERCSI
eukprot:4407045-Heterocapsa_arctica.AAC.1